MIFREFIVYKRRFINYSEFVLHFIEFIVFLYYYSNRTSEMNFFKALFGSKEETPEEKTKGEVARNFDTLKYDGVRA